MPAETNVFISYATDTKPAAEVLARALEEHGFHAWADFKDLHAGQRWQREIERAATSTATENENTIPMLANVRSIPEAIPKSLPGATFITAELFAGMNAPAPSPFSTAATVTTPSGVVGVSWE